MVAPFMIRVLLAAFFVFLTTSASRQIVPALSIANYTRYWTGSRVLTIGLAVGILTSPPFDLLFFAIGGAGLIAMILSGRVKPKDGDPI